MVLCERKAMNTKGISGFGAISIIIVLLLIGYIAYQIGRLQFTCSAIKGKVEDAAELGLAQNDKTIVEGLTRDAAELKVQLLPEQIFVDHSIDDSLRIYIEYNDSSNIFGFIYHRHNVIDITRPIKVRY